MEVSLVENIEAQLENSHTGSALDLSLIGKGKEFRKLRTYTASLFILLMVVSDAQFCTSMSWSSERIFVSE